MANEQRNGRVVPVILMVSLLLIGGRLRARAITEAGEPAARLRSESVDCGGSVTRSTCVLHSFMGQSTPAGWSQSAAMQLRGGMGYILRSIKEEESPVVVNEETGLGLPQEYFLCQNSPNPFNPSTTIRYQLPETGEVKFAIYDLLGQEICVLVSERQPAGWYRVMWDGNDEAGRQVSSGVYLYKLEVAEEFVQTRKMLLVR